MAPDAANGQGPAVPCQGGQGVLRQLATTSAGPPPAHKPQPTAPLTPWSCAGCATRPIASLVARVDVYSFRWLPGTTSLLVRSEPGLARIDLDTAALPASPLLALDWVAMSSARDTRSVCLDLIPGLPAAIMHHCTQGEDEAGPGQLVIALTVVDTLTLVELESRKYMAPRPEEPEHSGGAQGEHPSLFCGCGAVALSLGLWSGFRVYELNGGSPGTLLLCNDDLRHVSWSSCCRFLAGLHKHLSVLALDGRSGCSLALLSPGDLWSDYKRLRSRSPGWQVLIVS